MLVNWRLINMIKINVDNKVMKEIIDSHYVNMKLRIEEQIKNIIIDDKNKKRYKKLIDYLCDISGKIDENKLRKLLTGTKSELIEIINSVGEIELQKNDSFARLYINFRKSDDSKTILNKLNVNVCPYCNRLYTFTLAREGIRPQFDHYFPKSKFAYLSVSLYNLIPSCSICNQKKSKLNTFKEENELFYPYEDEFGNEVFFQTEPIDNDFLYWTGINRNFNIIIKSKNNEHYNKIENLKEHLRIQDLYNGHKDFIQDIIRNAVIYNDSRIEELLEQFPEFFSSKQEVLNLIFMNDIEKENWGKRSLSKLTHDVYNEFQIVNK